MQKDRVLIMDFRGMIQNVDLIAHGLDSKFLLKRIHLFLELI